MIFLHDSTGSAPKQFGNFESLCTYFNRLETLKEIEAGEGDGIDGPLNWRIVFYSYDRLYDLYKRLKPQNLSSVEYYAWSNRLSMVEFYQGDGGSPSQYAVTADLDLETLLRGWAHGYALAHSLTVLEVIKPVRGSWPAREAGGNSQRPSHGAAVPFRGGRDGEAVSQYPRTHPTPLPPQTFLSRGRGGVPKKSILGPSASIGSPQNAYRKIFFKGLEDHNFP